MSETISIEQVRTWFGGWGGVGPKHTWSVVVVNDLDVLDIRVNVTMICEGAKRLM